MKLCSSHNPVVTVYMPTYNYGRYISQAIESVMNQLYEAWELIIIDDGSTDNTRDILAGYARHPKINIIYQENNGLAKSNNKAIQNSKGIYIVRLDADDYLDENALLVMANILDKRHDIGLVYPDYYVVSNAGDLLRLERRKAIGKEVALFDLPAHGACTMIRKSCLLELGGYNENLRCQDGYDLWIRFIQRFKVLNVNLPLFYYRKHPGSLTTHLDRILETRQQIKRAFVEENGKDKLKILGIIPVSSVPKPHEPMGALFPVAGKPMIDYTILAALESNALDKIVVTSDSSAVLQYVSGAFKAIQPIHRSAELAMPHTRLEPTILHVLGRLKDDISYVPDAVMLLFINAPLRKGTHIQKAIDTLEIFSCDSVVSVAIDDRIFYRHLLNGLEPIIAERKLRLEKDVFYAENGAILLSKVDTISNDSFIGRQLGHIQMAPKDSFQVDSLFELWLVDKILSERHYREEMLDEN